MLKTLLRNTLITLFTVISLSTCAENKFTGTYMVNARPQELIYLALTQTQDSIAGAMTVVTPNKKGGVESQTIPLRGTADGSAISLVIERFLNNLAITGRKKRGSIVLTFPSKSGGLSTLTFEPASESDFNNAVTKWRQTLLVSYTNQAQLKSQETAEHQKLKRLAYALNDNVSAINTTEMRDDLSQAKSALQYEHSALKELEVSLAELKRNASLHPMTCYQAHQVVSYDFNQTMGFVYKQTLGYANSQFQSATNKLEDQLSRTNGMLEQIEKTSAELRNAIKVSSFPLPNLAISSGDEQAPMEQYKMLARSSKEELPALKAQNEKILTKANDLMHEGKGLMESAKSLVRCQ